MPPPESSRYIQLNTVVLTDKIVRFYFNSFYTHIFFIPGVEEDPHHIVTKQRNI